MCRSLIVDHTRELSKHCNRTRLDVSFYDLQIIIQKNNRNSEQENIWIQEQSVSQNVIDKF